MKLIWPVVIAGLLASLSTTAAARQPKNDVTKIQAFSLEKTQKLGYAIYLEDQAAWHATDLMLESKVDMNGLFGWVAAPTPGGVRVRFLKGSRSAPKPAYDILFIGSEKPTLAAATDKELTADEAAQVRALDTAMKVNLPRCSDRPPNHVELRDPDTGEWLVWFLTPWTEEGVPFGGHVRVTVSADGRRVLRTEKMSASCLRIPIDDDKEKRTAAMMVSQLVADTPLETHVFNALQTGRSVGVLTPDANVWMVDGKTIEKIGNLDDPKPVEPPPGR